MRTALTTVLMVVAVAVGAAHAEEQPRAKLALLPLVGNGVPKDKIAVLEELLLNELFRARRFDVIGASDLNALLGLERMKDAANCNDVACAVEIGGALGVTRLVAGTVNVLGGEVIISLKLIDTETPKVMNRSQMSAPNDESKYRATITKAAEELLGGEAAPGVPTPPPTTAPPATTAGWIGLRGRNMDAPTAARLGLPNPIGVVVEWVAPGGPVAKAGIQIDDVIVQANSSAINDMTALASLIGATTPGTSVAFAFFRKGQLTHATVLVGAQAPPPTAVPASATAAPRMAAGWLGLSGRDVDTATAARLGLPKPIGVVVERVEPGGPAAIAGIQTDDVVVRAGTTAIDQMATLAALIGATAPGTTLTVAFYRNAKLTNAEVIVGRAARSERATPQPPPLPRQPAKNR